MWSPCSFWLCAERSPGRSCRTTPCRIERRWIDPSPTIMKFSAFFSHTMIILTLVCPLVRSDYKKNRRIEAVSKPVGAAAQQWHRGSAAPCWFALGNASAGTLSQNYVVSGVCLSFSFPRANQQGAALPRCHCWAAAPTGLLTASIRRFFL